MSEQDNNVRAGVQLLAAALALYTAKRVVAAGRRPMDPPSLAPSYSRPDVRLFNGAPAFGMLGGTAGTTKAPTVATILRYLDAMSPEAQHALFVQLGWDGACRSCLGLMRRMPLAPSTSRGDIAYRAARRRGAEEIELFMMGRRPGLSPYYGPGGTRDALSWAQLLSLRWLPSSAVPGTIGRGVYVFPDGTTYGSAW